MSATHTQVAETTFAMDCIEGLCGHDNICPTLTLDICRECSDRNWDEHEGGVVLWVGHLTEAEDLCLDEFDLPTAGVVTQEGESRG